MKAFAFYTFKHFCYSGFWREIYLKNISTDGESEEIDEFHDTQKCLDQSSSKKHFTKKFHGFCMFFKFKRSVFDFFFSAFFFYFFFYCFLSAVIKEEIQKLLLHNVNLISVHVWISERKSDQNSV